MHPATTSLPDEVLDDVFHAVLTRGAAHWNQVAARRLLLSLVCHDWERILHSSARHWTHLPFFSFVAPAYLAYCLKRTKASNLTVQINTHDENGQYFGGGASLRRVHPVSVQTLMITVNELLGPVASRVVGLEVTTVHLPEWAHVSDTIASIQFSSIKEAAFRVYIGQSAPQSLCELVRASASPSSLSFDGVSPRFRGQSMAALVCLQLNGLYDVAALKWTDLSSALASAIALRKLGIHEVDCMELATAQSVTLLGLQSLSIAFNFTNCHHIIRHLKLPQVLRLRVSLAMDDALPDFVASAAHILPSLTHVALSVGPVPAEDFRSLLVKLLRTRELEFTRSCALAVSALLAALRTGTVVMPETATAVLSEIQRRHQSGLLMSRLQGLTVGVKWNLIAGTAVASNTGLPCITAWTASFAEW
jgi:hypothetical protein